MDEKYAFDVEWYDPNAHHNRHFTLAFYPVDQSVEMVRLIERDPLTFAVRVQYDVKNRRVFLKRTKYPSVTVGQLHVGGAVSIFSRQLHIRAFADSFTRQALTKRTEA